MLNAKKYIVGNWKMNGTLAAIPQWIESVAPVAEQHAAGTEVIVCPPALFIHEMVHQLTGFAIHLGGQDCHAEPSGAYTGDISAAMLKEAGCSHVIVGHSERRQHHRENSAQIAQKAHAALAAGVIPIICIGETLEERRSGLAEMVVEQQVAASLPKSAASGNFMLAYEPVWAIGSGQTPTTGDIRQMHAHVSLVASKVTGLQPEAVRVLYGGSVKAANAREIMATEGVCGVLVGGASLKVDEFNAIIAAA